eukprot:NODE_383_length_1716_cov_107.497900_g303_i0.p1 GENE.NODE_383_length_1716_cov_107.497900_g303_i0~~NODE_383_length_1716_cov_107.497900_g303_i0.p1  ORF type:complete len:415 (+),score=92.05 NODE_383_length_1716_cov_107.497900_g303_i0:298-1542(+)
MSQCPVSTLPPPFRIAVTGPHRAAVLNALVREFLCPHLRSTDVTVELHCDGRNEIICCTENGDPAQMLPLEVSADWKVLLRAKFMKSTLRQVERKLEDMPELKKVEVHFPFRLPFPSLEPSPIIPILLTTHHSASAPAQIVFETADVLSVRTNGLVISLSGPGGSCKPLDPDRVLAEYLSGTTSKFSRRFDLAVRKLMWPSIKRAHARAVAAAAGTLPIPRSPHSPQSPPRSSTPTAVLLVEPCPPLPADISTTNNDWPTPPLTATAARELSSSSEEEEDEDEDVEVIPDADAAPKEPSDIPPSAPLEPEACSDFSTSSSLSSLSSTAQTPAAFGDGGASKKEAWTPKPSDWKPKPSGWKPSTSQWTPSAPQWTPTSPDWVPSHSSWTPHTPEWKPHSPTWTPPPSSVPHRILH